MRSPCCGEDHRQIVKHCVCAELGATELEKLDVLVNDAGLNQVEASRMLWGRPLWDEAS